MSQLDATMVGNEFALPKVNLPIQTNQPKAGIIREELSASIIPEVVPVATVPQFVPAPVNLTVESVTASTSLWSKSLNILHQNSIIAFSLLVLIVGSSAIIVAGRYLSPSLAISSSTSKITPSPAVGLNISVPAAQLATKLNQITSQPATLTVGSNAEPISASAIKSWLVINESQNKSTYSIHVSAQAMASSLKQLADQYVVSPVNQVSVSHDNGATSQIILAGVNGTALADPSNLNSQAASAAKGVLYSKGLNFSTGLTNQPFQAVTAASFNKLIEVNLTTKQMYLYDNGTLTSTYAISAGKPTTPTPVGEFHIWEKLTSQTMTGYNPDGSTYVQPNVPWINYFDHSGDAIHGNYWRPMSVFGSVNTSHGCVSLPVDQAEVVYNWTTIGTTVITHE